MAEPAETFKVWIAILASCDADGIARVSSVFLSSVCHLDLGVIDTAILTLEGPDSRSRSTNDDGRRIRRIDGGFEVINYNKYREFSYSKKSAAIRQRKSRESRVNDIKCDIPVTCCDNHAHSASVFSSFFLIFWAKYPRKIAKIDALRIWTRVVDKEGADPNEIIRAVAGYVSEIESKKTEDRFIKHPATFLNLDRWRDYLPGSEALKTRGKSEQNGMEATRAIMRAEAERDRKK